MSQAITERMNFGEGAYRLYTSEPRTRTIAIIGAGFSGTLVAANLLRLSRARPLRILLFDRVEIGPGLAYASRPYPFLLNVPVRCMSATSADALDFLTFVQRDLPRATPDSFVPRELYGEYLRWILVRAEAASSPHVQLVPVKGSAHAIERTSSAFRIRMSDGRAFAASTIVLALGNPPPARIPAADSVRGSSRYVEDPWVAPVNLKPRETVLILGTGPTMADVALAGDETAHGRALIYAISRHGLISTIQRSFRDSREESASVLARVPDPLSTRRLVRWSRELCDEAMRSRGDWRGAISCLRAVAPTLWRRLSERERRRFLRHVRAYWDLHRHRLPPRTWSAIERLRNKGTLHVHAGHAIAMQLAGKRIRVRWRARGEQGDRMLMADRVINCTGPDYNLCNTRDRLLHSLFVRGLAMPDPLGLGLLTDDFGALRGANGRPSQYLYCVGPMLRADHWESTAVTELRVHAEQLARHLATAEEGQYAPSRGIAAAVR